jgi:hypothetical protein
MRLSVLLVGSIICCCQAWIPRVHGNGIGRPQAAVTTQLNVFAKVKNGWNRVKDSITNKERSPEELKIGIAGFYGELSRPNVLVKSYKLTPDPYGSQIGAVVSGKMSGESTCIMDITFRKTERIISKPKSI